MGLLKRPWVQNIALVIGSLGVALLAGEIAGRIAGFSGYEDYSPDPVIGWTLAPNQKVKTKVGGFPVSIDSDGFRWRELERQKDPHTVRIFALGNSATFGWGVPQDSVYNQLLQQMLNDSAAASGSPTRYEIVNAGVNAYNTYQEYRLMQRIQARYQPDGYIFAFAFNDAWNRFGRLTDRQRKTVLAGVRIKNVLRRSALYNWLIEARGRALYDRMRGRLTGQEALAHGGVSSNAEQDLADYRHTLVEVTTMAQRSNRALSFVVLASRSKDPFWPYQQAMLEAGAASGVPALDVGPAFAAASADSLFLADDAVHPTVRGEQLVARLLYRELCGWAARSGATNPGAVYRAGCPVALNPLANGAKGLSPGMPRH